MKKLVSFLVVAMMMATMSLTSFAANATFSAVSVEKGATTATADYVLTFDEGSSIGMLQLNLLLPEGITLSNVDFSEFTAKCDKITDDNNFEIGQLLIYDDDMDVAISGDLKLTFTFALAEGLAAGSYAIEIDESNTMVINPDGDALIDSFPGTTITVAAPAPDKTDVVVAPVASYDKSDAFEKDGAEYYHAAFKKEITVTADNNAVAGLKLEADKEVDVMFDTVVKDGTVNVAINILNVPADATLGTITITPIAE